MAQLPLVYHGPLLIYLLGVAPSTFTTVYSPWVSDWLMNVLTDGWIDWSNKYQENTYKIWQLKGFVSSKEATTTATCDNKTEQKTTTQTM